MNDEPREQLIERVRAFLDKRLKPEDLQEGELEGIAIGVSVSCELFRQNLTPEQRAQTTPFGYTVNEMIRRYEFAVDFYKDQVDPQKLIFSTG